MREQIQDSRPMRTMDWLIVALIVCAVVLPFLMASANTDARQTIQTGATALAVLGCVLMLSWMSFADGANSRVWSWLPPFWPWGRYLTGTVSRWGFVVVLVVGTVCGILVERFSR
jgi:uncharacterized BrkB/YihY/UPF0761 family membrane protein